MTLITNPKSYLKAHASSLHTRWCDSLRGMKTAAPEAQAVFRDDLTEIYRDVQRLVNDSGNDLDPISLSQLLHILNRPIQQHFAIITTK
jgi:hypothetical protein